MVSVLNRNSSSGRQEAPYEEENCQSTRVSASAWFGLFLVRSWFRLVHRGLKLWCVGDFTMMFLKYLRSYRADWYCESLCVIFYYWAFWASMWFPLEWLTERLDLVLFLFWGPSPSEFFDVSGLLFLRPGLYYWLLPMLSKPVYILTMI